MKRTQLRKHPLIRKVVAGKKALTKGIRGWQKRAAKRLAFVKVWRNVIVMKFESVRRSIVRLSPPWLRRFGRVVWIPFAYCIRRIRAFLKRRPHRSFRLTKRRDYVRSLQMPGYWAFTNSVRAMLWNNWRLFGGITLTYFVIAYVLNSFGQQEAYANLSDVLSEAGGSFFQGQMGQVAGAGLLLLTSVTTGLTPNVTEAQTILGGLVVFFAWLATVWALRNTMAGHKVKVRDAVYSSGAPVVPTFLVSFVIIVQILPVSLALLIYNAAIASEFISGGVEAMLAWVVVALLGILSLYLIAGTVMALIVVTLPGMYPIRAIQVAGDLVVGRRLRIILRILWMIAVIIVTWALLVIPVILFDAWIKDVWPAIEWMPIVPFTILAMSSVTIVFAATYIYMLYRKVVEDGAAPA